MINTGVISNVIGVILMIVGVLMLTPLPFSFYFDSGDSMPLILSSIISVSIGSLMLYYKFKDRQRIGKKEGYLIVGLSWIGVGIVGTLPYVFSGVIPGVVDAFFESVSGLTTTGATVISDIESVPKGILFWRSLTQWIGGMGIIVLTVAIFPLLGIGGVELFVAEAPGPSSDKIHPRIKETAKRLWLIYIFLTLILIFILWFSGMTFYEAINHALTTMSTGGFSTRNGSIAEFAPHIHYILLLFMFIAGINYTVIYYGLKGRFRKVWSSDEFKAYALVVATIILMVSLFLFLGEKGSWEESFRMAAFQVVSVITTTGYITADYTSWAPSMTLLFFVLLFVGASAGSTSGSIKIIRHLVFVKNSLLEFKRLLHPNALIRIKIDKKLVAPRILTHILVFLLIYLSLFIVGSISMSVVLLDFDQPILTAVGSVATALGNVGPGIGEVGPSYNFMAIPGVGKIVLTLLMLLGRLELFTIVIIFMPYFWRTA